MTLSNARNLAVLMIAVSGIASAQATRIITLRQAVALALRQNPDVVLARLEAEKAGAGAAVARGAFSPQARAGSGLGYTTGIPQSVEGATPSVVQATARMTVYDRQAERRVRQAEAEARATAHSAAAAEDEVAYQIAAAYLDFEQSSRMADLLRQQAESYQRAEQAVAARVEEGRDIPLALTQARLDRTRAQQRLLDFSSRRRLLEARLRLRLALGADVRLEPSPDESLPPIALPIDAAAVASDAVAHSPEIKGLEASARAGELAIEAEKGARYPRLDLVGQYALLARFNNYDEFFNRFQRHNGQVGVSLTVPLWSGRAVSARVEQARIAGREAVARRDARAAAVRLESYELFDRAKQAEGGLQVARLELDFARQSLDVLIARYEEGRIALDEVERARARESLAWEGFYSASYNVRKTRLNVLRRTGELAAALGPPSNPRP